MAITITGPTKLVTLDTSFSFDFRVVYDTIIDWSCGSSNMQYTLPCQGAGKVPLGGGVFTDTIYTILNGWKLKPSGYTTGDQVSVIGTVVTSDASAATVAPTIGGAPVWIFKVASNGIIATTGGSSSDPWLADLSTYTVGTAGATVNQTNKTTALIPALL